MKNCQLQAKGVNHLIRLLCFLPEFHYLFLQNNNLQNCQLTDLKRLCQKGLKNLDLQDCQLGDTGAHYLSI